MVESSSRNPDDGRTILDEIATLTNRDLLEFRYFAESLLRKRGVRTIGGLDGEDFVHQAILKVLDGTRTVRPDIGVQKTILGTIMSDISHAR